MVVVERRHPEVVVVENKHLEMVIAGDWYLEQDMQLELLFQTTCYPYSHMVSEEDGQLVELVVVERHPELVLEEVGNRKKHEPPF